MSLNEIVSQEDKRIYISDARNCFGGCIPGWQKFAETYNFSWKEVIRHGLLASELLATGDAMAESLVRYIYFRRDV